MHGSNESDESRFEKRNELGNHEWHGLEAGGGTFFPLLPLLLFSSSLALLFPFCIAQVDRLSCC